MQVDPTQQASFGVTHSPQVLAKHCAVFCLVHHCLVKKPTDLLVGV